MSIGPGARIGHYEITDSLGKGGMGEVWRARDPELERDVAIKVLPQSFAENADRIARFEREARTLAALNHTNIAHIYGIERSGVSAALVMELIDGPTLADRIGQGPIPADEALGIAQQIAAALEAAHARGIVHRDLKPANVKLKPDGTVKVLDFGIAKALAPEVDQAQSPIMTTPVTQVGVILGTAAYMSPEQARGKPVDQRTDIWAFGCLLYEMLTGQLAFGGEDVAVIMARVIANDADMGSLPRMISPAVRHTIKVCLEKDPNKRIADIRDVRLALAGTFEPEYTGPGNAGAAVLPIWRRPLPFGAAMLVLGLFAAAVVTWSVLRPGPPDIALFDITPDDHTLMFSSASLAISPDGKSVAYLVGGDSAAGGELRLRTLARLEANALVTGSPVASPFFSPDGLQIGFFENPSPRVLKRVSVQGGTPSTITALPGSLRGASWGADGNIVFGTSDQASGLWRVPAAGGEPEPLTTLREGEINHFWPDLLPGGEAVLFTVIGEDGEARIAALSLATGEHRTVVPRGSFPRYSPTGHVLYGRDGTLWAVAFDPDSLATRGNPVPALEGVLTKGVNATEVGLAANGTLVYVAADATPQDYGLVWVDATGHEEVALPTAGGIVQSVGVSPDGTRAALSILTDASTANIFLSDLRRGTLVPLTRGAGLSRNPIFSSGQGRIAWGLSENGRASVLWQLADGSGQAQTLASFEPPVARAVPTSWSPDGAILALGLVDSDGSRHMGVITIGDPESFRPLGTPDLDQWGPAISPDGRWLAYVSNDRGFSEVFVERFPDGGGRQSVSVDGGYFPAWTDDGRALIYVRGANSNLAAVVRVEITADETGDGPLVLGARTDLFPWDYFLPDGSYAVFGMVPDGQRFLVIGDNTSVGQKSARIILVQNWTEELKRLVPVD